MSRRKWVFTMILVISMLLMVACSQDEVSNEQGTATSESESSLGNYPDQTIEFLVGYTAGGALDVMARNALKALTDGGIIDQDMVVENIPGSSGAQALNTVFKNSTDPNALLFMTDEGVTLQTDLVNFGVSDFKQVAGLVGDTFTIVVSIESPYNNITELLDVIKKDPGSVNVALGGAVGGGHSEAWNQIAEAYDIPFEEMNFIPTGGSSDAIVSVLNGQADVGLFGSTTAADYTEAGEAKALAVMGKERSEIIPGVQTLTEQGVDLVYEKVRGVWVGSEVPDEVVEFWATKFEEMVETDVWQDYIASNGQVDLYLGPEEYTQLVEEKAPEFEEFMKKVEAYR